MKDHMKTSMIGNSDHTILHVETNDLIRDRSPDLIAKYIVDLTMTLNYNSQNVSVSNIIMHNENFSDKTMEVNGYLNQFCIENLFDEPYQKVSYISKSQVKLFSEIILLRQYQVVYIDIK